MGSKRTENTLGRKLLAAAVACCFSHAAMAAPSGATVASGSASITTSGSTMTVTNTPNAIINWASFGIAAGETVKFVQQSSASTVLNRVTGSDPSYILGALQSNGKVFLINPNGIMFGANARIDVNGLVASTLNITDADFLNGRMRFNADRAAPGSVVNAGQITTPSGGFVYLVAPNVENSGIITTPSGEAILAAGNSVEIVDSTDPSQRVLVSATSQDVNLSQLMTQSNGDIFSVLNSGRVSANTVVQDATGRIYFKSAGNIQTTSTSVVEARGDLNADGGTFRGFADQNGVYAGSFDVSGKNGGFVETSGHWIDVNSAQINMRALDPNGKGGTLLLDPTDICIEGDGCSPAPTYTGSFIDASTINTWMINNPNSTYILSATNDIYIDQYVSISSSYGSSLSLNAGRDILMGFGTYSPTISLNSSLSSGNPNVYFTATRNIAINGGSISVGDPTYSTYAEIAMHAANISLTGATLSADSNPSYGNYSHIGLHALDSVSVNNSTLTATDDIAITAMNNHDAFKAYKDAKYGNNTLATPKILNDLFNVAVVDPTDNIVISGSTLNADIRIDLASSNITINGGSGLSAGNEFAALAKGSFQVQGNGTYIEATGANYNYASSILVRADNIDIAASAIDYPTINAYISCECDSNANVSMVASKSVSIDASDIEANSNTISGAAAVAISGGSSVSIVNSLIVADGLYQADIGISGNIVTITGPGGGYTSPDKILATSASGIGNIAISGTSSLTLSGAYLDAVSNGVYPVGVVYPGVELSSQTISLSNTWVYGDYVGLNYPLNLIQTRTSEFFNLNSSAKVTVDSSNITASSGIGFSGNDVTVTNSYISSDLVHGIANNELRLVESTLYADSEMMLEAGKGIFLDKSPSGYGSVIGVNSIDTLYFVFPLLGSGGWFVDGIPNALSGPYSSIAVDLNTVLGVNFFVTYGGLSLIGPVLYPILDPFLPSYPYPYNPYIGYVPNPCDFGFCDMPEPPGVPGIDEPHQCSGFRTI